MSPASKRLMMVCVSNKPYFVDPKMGQYLHNTSDTYHQGISVRIEVTI